MARASGISPGRINDYWNGPKLPLATTLFALAESLSVSAEWLALGRVPQKQSRLIDAADADWVEIPEFALLEIDEQGKLDPISVTTMRRDWLYSSLGESSDLWIARLPAPYDAVSLNTGTPLICKDHRPGERMIDGTHYLFRVNGGIVMARFAFRDPGTGDRVVLSRDLGYEEDQYQVVARVVGVIAHPI